jgi:hypothetical protein
VKFASTDDEVGRCLAPRHVIRAACVQAMGLGPGCDLLYLYIE